MNVIRGHSDAYELSDCIGKGTYGSVFRCTSVHTKNVYAVKRQTTEEQGFPCVMECAIQATISHPFLMSMIDRCVVGNLLYVIQPLALEDAQMYLRASGVMVDELPILLMAWSYQLIQAVACLHRYGIIHGDIKPANVLIMSDETVRLADFTLSVQELEPGQQFHHTAYTITHRAPEVMEAALIPSTFWGRPADVWALGCTLFELGYKTGPFRYQASAEVVQESSDLLEISLAHIATMTGDAKLRARWPRPSTSAVAWPDDITGSSELNAIVRPMLAVDVHQRQTILQSLQAREWSTPLAEFSITTPATHSTFLGTFPECSDPTVPKHVLDHAQHLYTLLSIEAPYNILICIVLKLNGQPFHRFITKIMKEKGSRATEIRVLKHFCFRVIKL